MQKSTKKKNNIRKITSFPKWENFAIMLGEPFQNRQFGSKIKMFKNMRKTSPEPQQIFPMQKATPENT